METVKVRWLQLGCWAVATRASHRKSHPQNALEIQTLNTSVEGISFSRCTQGIVRVDDVGLLLQLSPYRG
jgi:hypothetical protein